ncbi:NAD(P)-dependent oxidoreductase [Kitasatospora sp. NPDC001574]
MSSTASPIETPVDVIVFGAGGQVGRAVVAEARRRGLTVTAAVRDPGRHADLTGPGVTLVSCDITDPAAVTGAARGHSAAVSTVYTPDVPSAEFYPAAARALVAGLPAAGVRRLVHVGVATTLETAPGVAVHDDPAFPEAHRAFSLGHAAALDLLRASPATLDWVTVTPPLDLDRTAAGTGRYRLGGPQVLGRRIAQADLAVAVADQLTGPAARHREQIAVAE